jgi:hypothetical protein
MKYYLALSLLAVSSSLFATPYYCEGKVVFVRVMDPIMWGEDRSYIRLSNCPEAGTCLKEQDSVVLGLRDNDNASKQISLALSAQARDKNILVQVDDAHKNSVGSCYIGFVTSLNH